MKRLTIFIVISLIFAGISYAEIDLETCVGMWLFDEDSGNVVHDSSEKLSKHGNIDTIERSQLNYILKANGLEKKDISRMLNDSSMASSYTRREETNRGVETISEIVGGYLGGATGWFGWGFVASILYPDKAGELGRLVIGFPIGATPGMLLASSGSVYFVGQTIGNGRGSYGQTLLGASIPVLLGAIVGLGIGIAEANENEEPELLAVGPLWGACFGSVLSPIGATIGYRCSLQPQEHATLPLRTHKSLQMADNNRGITVPLIQIAF
jgi:hypothetical protein